MKDPYADKRLLIYVSCPYTPAIQNEPEAKMLKKLFVKLTAQTGEAVAQKGHIPLMINTTFGYWEYHSNTFNYDFCMRLAYQYLDPCDAILFLGPSHGTRKELAYAIKQGKLVFTDINQVPALPPPALQIWEKNLVEPRGEELARALRKARLRTEIALSKGRKRIDMD